MRRTAPLLVVACAAAAQAQQPPRVTDSTLFNARIAIDRTYELRDTALGQLMALSRKIGPTRVVNPRGQSPVKLLWNVYGFGPSNKPEVFDSLLKETLRLNGATSDEDFPAGEVFIPTVPPWLPVVGYSAAEPTRGFKAARASVRKPTIVKLPVVAASKAPAVADVGPVRAPTWIAEVRNRDTTLTAAFDLGFHDAAQYSSFISAASSTTKARSAFLVLSNAPMFAEYGFGAVRNPDDSHYELTSDERARLVAGEGQCPHDAVPLIVLDTGWPTPADRDSALSYFYSRMRNQVDEWKRLDPNRLFTKDLPSFATPPLGAQVGAPPDHHVVLVKDAMGPLSSVDHCGAVRVIFVPLTPAQGGGQLLEDIVLFAELAPWMQYRSPPDLKYLRTAAHDAVAGIDSVVRQHDLTNVLVANAAVVDGLVNALASSDSRNRMPVIVNTSWTLSNSVTSPRFVDASRVLIVAAAGNADIDVHQNQIGLGVFADVSPPHVLTVVNVDSHNARTCTTNFVDNNAPAAVQSRVVGYRGGLRPDACGSSFSAPRVAWSIAFWVSQLSQNARSSWFTLLSSELQAVPATAPGRGEKPFVLPPPLPVVP